MPSLPLPRPPLHCVQSILQRERDLVMKLFLEVVFFVLSPVQVGWVSGCTSDAAAGWYAVQLLSCPYLLRP